MYYPYLRGRQNELLAIKEFAEKLNGEKSAVFPIIEPVRSDFGAVQRMISSIEQEDMQCGIILNPEYGDLKDLPFIDLNEVKGNSLFSFSQCHPAFILNDICNIEKAINSNEYKEVILITPKGIAIDDKQFDALITTEKIKTIITDPSRRSIIRAARKKKKLVVELEDKFLSQASNAGYKDRDDEEFTQECFYYKEDNYDGFSDYTVLPNEFKEGGMLPKVVVIHLTYIQSEDKVNIKHFCSYSNSESNSNTQGKFIEAAKDAIDFFSERTLENGNAIQKLKSYVVSDTFPGLGVIKRISILHHLELMQKILSENEKK